MVVYINFSIEIKAVFIIEEVYSGHCVHDLHF